MSKNNQINTEILSKLSSLDFSELTSIKSSIEIEIEKKHRDFKKECFKEIDSIIEKGGISKLELAKHFKMILPKKTTVSQERLVKPRNKKLSQPPQTDACQNTSIQADSPSDVQVQQETPVSCPLSETCGKENNAEYTDEIPKVTFEIPRATFTHNQVVNNPNPEYTSHFAIRQQNYTQQKRSQTEARYKLNTE